MNARPACSLPPSSIPNCASGVQPSIDPSTRYLGLKLFGDLSGVTSVGYGEENE